MEKYLSTCFVKLGGQPIGLWISLQKKNLRKRYCLHPGFFPCTSQIIEPVHANCRPIRVDTRQLLPILMTSFKGAKPNFQYFHPECQNVCTFSKILGTNLTSDGQTTDSPLQLKTFLQINLHSQCTISPLVFCLNEDVYLPWKFNYRKSILHHLHY